MPDAWETAYGLNPFDPADALLDADGDGMSNRDEYLAGTDPRDAASVLRILAVTPGAGTLTFTVQAVAGRSYVIERATALGAGWEVAQTFVGGAANGPVDVIVPLRPDAPAGFFRVQPL
jgi:hypothetical protein